MSIREGEAEKGGNGFLGWESRFLEAAWGGDTICWGELVGDDERMHEILQGRGGAISKAHAIKAVD